MSELNVVRPLDVDPPEPASGSVAPAGAAPAAPSEEFSPHVVFTKHLCKFAHINIREEKHGDEPVPGADLKLVANVSNAWLLNLAPGLREALYARTKRDLFPDEPDHYPDLRFPAMAVIDWVGEWDDAYFSVDGPLKRDRMQFRGKVAKVRIDCRDGGTVIVTFRVSLEPDSGQVGKLVALLGKEEKVTVQTDLDRVIDDDPAD